MRSKVFTFNNCLFGANDIVRNSDKEEYDYNGYGITFDGKGSWSFGNELSGDVVSFGVDNSSSSLRQWRIQRYFGHTVTYTTNFLGETATYQFAL